MGRAIVDLTPGESSREDAEAIMANLSRGRSWAGEFPVRRKDGSQFTAFVVNSPILSEDGALLGIVGVSTDITERREVESQLRQSAKMEAVGRLAGGVAHDFNNLLTVILGNLEIAQAETFAEDQVREALASARDAAQRAADLTGQLLAFSRQDRMHPRVLDMCDALERMHPLLRRLIDESICIEVCAWSTPLCSVLDPGLVDQIFMNLAINARDAMPEGGTMRFTLEPVGSLNPRAEVDSGGDYLRLTVSDSGSGMTPDVMALVFEPFFTTKAPGRGTGLGLATIYAIVKQNGGTIDVESHAGAGTSFRIVLPRVGQAAELDPPGSDVPSAGGDRPCRLLLVEDEPAVRCLLRRTLERAGYVVQDAENAVRAREIARDATMPLDLLISDLVMPGGSGLDLALDLVAASPRLAVVLMSGYAQPSLHERAEAQLGVSILQKPFKGEALLRAASKALTRAATRVRALNLMDVAR